MAVNFIGPLLLLSGILSLIGIVVGIFKKDKKILRTSLIIFVIVVLIYVLAEGIFME